MLVTNEQMKKIEEFGLKKASKLDYSHNEDHVLRTVKLVEILAKKENADLEICRVAACLHDIGQSVQYENHEEIGAKMAKEFLKSLNFPDDFIEKVYHTIRYHANAYIRKAKTIEAKVLYDADKLQVVGIFGFCRIFSEQIFFSKNPLEGAIKEVERIQSERFKMLQTNSGRELIKKPHEFMREFYRLYKKWDKIDLPD